MKITTRMAIGFAILTLALVGTTGYQISVLQSVQQINRELSETNLDAARVSVRLLQGLEAVREFSEKHAWTGFEDYREQRREWERAVESELSRLAAVDLAGPPAAQRTRIVEGWEDFRGLAEALEAATPSAEVETMPLLELGPTRTEALAAVESRLLELRSLTDELIALNEASVTRLARESVEAGERARAIGWLAAIGAIVVALLAWLFLYLAISDPLRRLTRGTRELARGRFDHRLPEGGPSELSELARDFNDMAQKLGELETLKQDFVSHVSHELKAPLAAIQETILVFLDEIPGPITERQRGLLRLSRQSADRLSTMIDNLLEASRMEAGGPEYDPVRHDLARIIRSVVDEATPVAEERELHLGVNLRSDTLMILCDGDRIREVVSNLVGNALKFSPRGGRIRITAGRQDSAPKEVDPREQGPCVVLSVEDEGPGIPDGHKEAIFEKFHQVKPGRRIQGQGVGLGLAITRGIVEGHGGTIRVRDREGGGAHFQVVLPVTPYRWRGDPVGREKGSVDDPLPVSQGAHA